MLRSIFVIILLAIGWTAAFSSAVYAAALYLWIAYFRPESWLWNNFFSTWNLSYFAGIFFVVRTLVSGVSLRVTWRVTMLLLFLALAALSTWTGLHPEHSWPLWQAFGKTIVVSCLLTVVIKTEADLRLILFVIALSLGFEAAKQGWAQLILNPGGRNPNEIPFLGDNNLVAVGMAMLVPLLTALADTSAGWQKRGLQFLNVGVAYRGLSTYSRGGFLSLAAVAGLAFWRSERKGRALVAGAIVAVLILPALPPEFWGRMSTITASGEERELDESQSGRLYFWQVAFEMANDRPFLGVGHSGYEPTYDQYDTTLGRYGTRRAVHSAWFGVLAELGYFGLTAFVIIAFSSLRACGRVRRMAQRGDVSAAMGRYANGMQSALVAFMVGGSFVSFHYCEMLWHFFALTMALEQVAATQAADIRERQMREKAIPAVIAEPKEEFVWA